MSCVCYSPLLLRRDMGRFRRRGISPRLFAGNFLGFRLLRSVLRSDRTSPEVNPVAHLLRTSTMQLSGLVFLLLGSAACHLDRRRARSPIAVTNGSVAGRSRWAALRAALDVGVQNGVSVHDRVGSLHSAPSTVETRAGQRSTCTSCLTAIVPRTRGTTQRVALFCAC